MRIQSPLRSRMCLHEKDICVGCFRSIEEIMLWDSVSGDEKLRILKNSVHNFGHNMQKHDLNAFGQPIGAVVPDWKAPPRPPREAMQGRYCRLEPIDPDKHAAALFEANRCDTDGRMWTYMAYGPWETLDAFREWMKSACCAADPMFFAIVVGGKPVGVASFMRIAPNAGTIEVGGLAYSPLLTRTRAATEAMYLMMKRAFELGYRRYEWKCNALNDPSRAAARRLGFQFEGVFRQADVVKGRNRDTAWFSIIDGEWPRLKSAFEKWLSPENFGEQGKQKTPLSKLTAAARSEAQ